MQSRAQNFHDGKQSKGASVESPTRQRIITQARQHFFARGFRSVTMDDLSADLGMSKKTLYAYFASKSELLSAVFLDKFRTVEEDFEGISSEAAYDFPARLRELLACVQRHIAEVGQPFVRDMRKDPQLFAVIENRRRDLIQRYFGRLLEEGQKEGVIRSDIPAGLLIEILLAAVQAIINPERLAELDITPSTGFSVILAVILEGMLTDTGRSAL
jgi:AcrR family transcriptional regulator